jgi:branched-chain amino acid transport system ATP-binding protein
VSGQLTVTEVAKDFGGVRAVDGVSFTIAAGTIAAVVGANGAGKTTLLDLISGFHRPDYGRIELDGHDVTGWTPQRLCAAGIGRGFRPARPFAGLSVEDTLAVAALSWVPDLAEARRHGLQVLERLELLPLRRRPAASLTRAEGRWLELARALATRPRVLLLDEVLAGLAPAELDRMIERLRGLHHHHRQPLTLVLAEHGLHAVSALAEWVVVLNHGVVIAEGPPDQVAAAPAVIEAGLGLDLP